MKIAEFDEMTGFERAEAIVGMCRSTGFYDRFSLAELGKLHRALVLCQWDFFPDEWMKRQVAEALNGRVPRWKETPNGYEPVYPGFTPGQMLQIDRSDDPRAIYQ